MSEREFSAVITDESKIVPDNRPAWVTHLYTLRGQRVVITIDKEYNRRSKRANAYYQSRVVPVFQQIWSRARMNIGLPSLTKEQTHEVLCEVILGREDGNDPWTRVRRSTRKMNTAVFSKFVDDARELAWQQYQINIPPADERWEDET